MNKVRIPMGNVKIMGRRIRPSDKSEEEYQLLKKSIKMLGLSNEIIVTQELELIAGYWRLKAFIELHEEDPSNEAYIDIPTLIVTNKDEMEDLKLDFFDGRSNDYMRDTACDRLNMIYDKKQYRDKPLQDFLEINETELAHRVEIGVAIREGLIDGELLKQYKNNSISHHVIYEWLQEAIPLPDEVVEEEKPKFDVNKWI